MQNLGKFTNIGASNNVSFSALLFVGVFNTFYIWLEFHHCICSKFMVLYNLIEWISKQKAQLPVSSAQHLKLWRKK